MFLKEWHRDVLDRQLEDLNKLLLLLLTKRVSLFPGVPKGVAPRRPGPSTGGPQQTDGHHPEELPRLQDTTEVPHTRTASTQTRTQETGTSRTRIWTVACCSAPTFS